MATGFAVASRRHHSAVAFLAPFDLLELMLPLLALLCASPFETGPVPFEIGDAKNRLAAVTDGKGHFLLYDKAKPYDSETVFYGDKTAVHRMRVVGGGASGTESFEMSFWDPRHKGGNSSRPSFSMREAGKKFEIECSGKTTAVQPVDAEALKALVDNVKFLGPIFTRQPDSLLRDDSGKYYFVDRVRTDNDEDRRDYRVFVGARGKMKQMPLKDIVDDSEGKIFSTKNGNLRLIRGPVPQNRWVAGKSSKALTDVPIVDNLPLVYLELGVFAGMRLGTPCDDWM
jgi:hypothetical protein